MKQDYKVGDKVRCISHSGAWPDFWLNSNGPEVGQECEISDIVGRTDDDVICMLKDIDSGEYSFLMRDFELIEQN
jgi:hypothetical protein